MKGDDGYDHIGMIDASGGVLDQDYEMYEQQTPHMIVQHEYLCDSGGAGQWRGGLGTVTQIMLRGDDTTMVVFGDGDVEPNYGLFGGKGSVLNKIELRSPSPTLPKGKGATNARGGKNKTTAAISPHIRGDKNGLIVPMSKDIINGIPNNTLYLQIAGGGGGFGNPKKRDKERVKQDVKNEVVSKKSAKELYGLKK